MSTPPPDDRPTSVTDCARSAERDKAMNSDWRKGLFYISALYDGLLGLAFLCCWSRLFDYFHVTPPNHPGYVQFPALLLIIFGLLFLKIARDPEANRDL